MRTTIDYSGSSPAKTPEFGHSITFDGLGDGSHEILVQSRSGVAYVDGFEIISESGSGADESAAGTRSATTVSTGELSLAGTPVLTETTTVGPDDEWLSVIVEGAGQPLTVNLLDSLGKPTPPERWKCARGTRPAG